MISKGSLRRPLIGAVAIALVLGITRTAFADSRVIASSTFDTDSDGWVVKDLAFPNPGAPPVPINTFTPTYQSTGGNPGGHLSLIDPTANAWYWYAPAKFLGDRHAAYRAEPAQVHLRAIEGLVDVATGDEGRVREQPGMDPGRVRRKRQTDQRETQDQPAGAQRHRKFVPHVAVQSSGVPVPRVRAEPRNPGNPSARRTTGSACHPTPRTARSAQRLR